MQLYVLLDWTGLEISAQMRTSDTHIFAGVTLDCSRDVLLFLVVVEADEDEGDCYEENGVMCIHYNTY